MTPLRIAALGVALVVVGVSGTACSSSSRPPVSTEGTVSPGAGGGGSVAVDDGGLDSAIDDTDASDAGPCTNANCAGCCDQATNQCLAGNTVDACGVNGGPCTACTQLSGSTCLSGSCE